MIEDDEMEKHDECTVFFICNRNSVERQFTLVNKQIAYLLEVSLEINQIKVGKNLMLMLLLKASV
jgi:hypothetical protein